MPDEQEEFIQILRRILLAFRNKESLKYLMFIKSIKVKDMKSIPEHDSSEIAAKVALLMMERDGLGQDEALIRFMRSDTFERLASDMSMWDMMPEDLLDMYDEEVS